MHNSQIFGGTSDSSQKWNTDQIAGNSLLFMFLFEDNNSKHVTLFQNRATPYAMSYYSEPRLETDSESFGTNIIVKKKTVSFFKVKVKFKVLFKTRFV